jgi:hypothetical protein
MYLRQATISLGVNHLGAVAFSRDMRVFYAKC